MKKFLFPAALLTLAFSVQAQVTVTAPWVRATVAPMKATGAFFQLTASKDSRLVEVRSSAAAMVEIHEMALDGGVMRMRELEGGLPLPAGKTVELKPGGFHVMLMGLKKPLSAGDTVPLTLVVESKDRKPQLIEVKAEVRQLGAAAQH